MTPNALSGRRGIAQALPVLALSAFALSIVAAPGAQAAVQPRVVADLSKYCRTKFPNSTPTIRRGVDHYCNRGGSLQGIDLAEACRLTTGSRRYERMGARVLCFKTRAGAPRPGPRTDADFAKYCRAKYPNSVYRRLPTARGVKHVCRQVNAHGATNQGIDLAEACRMTTGSRRYSVSGARVLCRGVERRTAARRRVARRADRNARVRRGTYIWPHNGVIYRGPLKNGKPHGIGTNTHPKTGFKTVGQYRDGKPVGPFLMRLRGRLTCLRVYPNRRSRRLPLSRCAHLRGHLS